MITIKVQGHTSLFCYRVGGGFRRRVGGGMTFVVALFPG